MAFQDLEIVVCSWWCLEHFSCWNFPLILAWFFDFWIGSYLMKRIFSPLLSQISLSSFTLLKKFLNQSCRSLWDPQLWCLQLFILSRDKGEKWMGSFLGENRETRFHVKVLNFFFAFAWPRGTPWFARLYFCPFAFNDWEMFLLVHVVGGTQTHISMLKLFDQLSFFSYSFSFNKNIFNY